MKLCRFELVASPGEVRSGIVYGGKVYETQGTEPVAVHEWSDAKLLSPLGRPPSVRFFPAEGGAGFSQANTGLPFRYLNPATLVPPSQALRLPPFGDRAFVSPCLAFALAVSGAEVGVENGANLPIGLMLGMAFVHAEPHEGNASFDGRHWDAGFSFGPVITTLDELDETVVSDVRGPVYKLAVSSRLNGETIHAWDTGELQFTVAEAISYASESAPLSAGDVFLIGEGSIEGVAVEHGDEFQVACDRLGVLSIAIQ